MNKVLKLSILNFICCNNTEFQLHNATIAHYRAYIYDAKGEYLIGGEDVSNFIDNAIKLLAN